MDETIYEILKFALDVWFSIIKLAKKMDTLRKFSTCTQRKSVFSICVMTSKILLSRDCCLTWVELEFSTI